MGNITMNASERINGLIASLTDWRGTTFAIIRRIIHEADPEIIEEWKWMGTPIWSDDGIVFIANVFKDKVKLTFPWGANFADPDKLFNNGLTGKQWRSIDIFKDDKINETSLKILIHDAIEFNHSKIKATAKLHGARS